MNIGLVDVDGHKFPNLALMKISAYYKSKGYHTEFATMFEHYNKLFMSKVFTYTHDDYMIYDADEVIKAGTGYRDYETVLDYEIEHIYPDYGLYHEERALGFATRGCPNKCPWCVVPQKEGNIKPNAEIYEFWNGQKELVFLDNNILAHDYGLQQIENTIKEGIRIDCNQGLDARLIANDVEIQKLLARAKWGNVGIRLACDTKTQMEPVRKSVETIRAFANKSIPFFVYTLIRSDISDALERIYFLRNMKYVDPFAQPYRDFGSNLEPPRWQKQMARWVNHKAIFRSVVWDKYKR